MPEVVKQEQEKEVDQLAAVIAFLQSKPDPKDLVATALHDAAVSLVFQVIPTESVWDKAARLEGKHRRAGDTQPNRERGFPNVTQPALAAGVPAAIAADRASGESFATRSASAGNNAHPAQGTNSQRADATSAAKAGTASADVTKGGKS